MFNLLVVLGMSALFTPLIVGKNTLRSDFPFSIVCAFLLAVFGFTGRAASETNPLVIGRSKKMKWEVIMHEHSKVRK